MVSNGRMVDGLRRICLQDRRQTTAQGPAFQEMRPVAAQIILFAYAVGERISAYRNKVCWPKNSVLMC